MPTRYYCSNCHLGFETGWFHYHEELNGALAATFLVCTGCGSAYMLDHKCDGSRDQLYAWGGPVTWVASDGGSWHTHAPDTPDMSPVGCDYDFRPRPKKGKFAALEGIQDELNLAGFECVFCGAAGRLGREWPAGQRICPRCSHDALDEVSSYIT